MLSSACLPRASHAKMPAATMLPVCARGRRRGALPRQGALLILFLLLAGGASLYARAIYRKYYPDFVGERVRARSQQASTFYLPPGLQQDAAARRIAEGYRPSRPYVVARPSAAPAEARTSSMVQFSGSMFFASHANATLGHIVRTSEEPAVRVHLLPEDPQRYDAIIRVPMGAGQKHRTHSSEVCELVLRQFGWESVTREAAVTGYRLTSRAAPPQVAGAGPEPFMRVDADWPLSVAAEQAAVVLKVPLEVAAGDRERALLDSEPLSLYGPGHAAEEILPRLAARYGVGIETFETTVPMRLVYYPREPFRSQARAWAAGGELP